jgi:hypothetical protein
MKIKKELDIRSFFEDTLKEITHRKDCGCMD